MSKPGPPATFAAASSEKIEVDAEVVLRTEERVEDSSKMANEELITGECKFADGTVYCGECR